MNNVALIGFMGCGKTSAGRKLAADLGYDFLDMDEYIEQALGMTVAHIFKTYGEVYFRQAETELACGLDRDKCIISTGGGIIKQPENIRGLKRHSSVVFLKASPEVIFQRIADSNDRPLLNASDGLQKLLIIKSLLQEREPLYSLYADFTVETDEKTIDETAAEIAGLLRAYNL